MNRFNRAAAIQCVQKLKLMFSRSSSAIPLTKTALIETDPGWGKFEMKLRMERLSFYVPGKILRFTDF